MLGENISYRTWEVGGWGREGVSEGVVVTWEDGEEGVEVMGREGEQGSRDLEQYQGRSL